MKGIVKDHESITKDYESLFYSMKDQCKKKFALCLRPYIPIPHYWSGVSSIYDIIAAFKLSCKIFHIICTRSIYSPIIFKEVKFWDVALQAM